MVLGFLSPVAGSQTCDIVATTETRCQLTTLAFGANPAIFYRVMSHAAAPRQFLVTLDVEGVLTPEIWLALADEFALDDLRRTTQDEPNYQRLMDGRLSTLATHDITIDRIQKVIANLTPLEGAKSFLDGLREEMQVVLLSDTFEQFIGPLMAQLGQPTILCHHLDIANGRPVSFTPRLASQKLAAVNAFQAMNYGVIAAGDSFNDLEMIDAANAGFLFRAPARIKALRDDLAAFDTYADLTAAILKARDALMPETGA